MAACARRCSARSTAALAALGLVLGTAGLADAGDPDAGAVDAGAADAGDAGAGSADAGARFTGFELKLETQRAQVRALIAGELDAAVDPASLFVLPIDDEDAVRVEVATLEALARGLEPVRPKHGAPKVTSLDAGPAGEAIWAAQRGLDAARLDYLRLPAPERARLLAKHAARAAALLASRGSEDKTQTEREALEQAKATAKTARSEAERLISGEHLRLLGVKQAQETFATHLADQRQTMTTQRETVLGWQRRAREARQRGDPDDVDVLYDQLRAALRSARAELSAALDAIGDGPLAVPGPGADRLASLGTDADADPVRAERAALESTARKLARDEVAVRDERAAQLMEETDALNHERLSLLDSLSREKRAAITGFTGAGVDQAESELRHLTLILRYHRHATSRWLSSLRQPDQSIGVTVGRALLVLLQWALVFGAFFWWRRRGPRLLAIAQRRVAESDRHARLVSPSWAARALHFSIEVHGSLEWLLLVLVLSAFLPTAVTSLLEVQLVKLIFSWSLGGALVVDVVNALASDDPSRSLRSSRPDTSQLRLRSLRLVGRVVVTFILIILLTTRLVGAGTIYQWVLSTYWLAAIPVLLVLIRWWRDTVFTRTELSRKKSAFDRWVLANRDGWKSFIAASLGAGELFVRGAYRASRGWVGRFDLTRRVLAYLFRRELDKLGAEGTFPPLTPLTTEVIASLGPGRRSRTRCVTDVDDRLDAIAARLRDHKGGVFAVVGERGMGKSTSLGHLAAAAGKVLMIDVPKGGGEQLGGALATAAGLSAQDLAALARQIDGSGEVAAVMLDDAHRIVAPVMGGLAPFDELVAAARSHSKHCAWVFALDAVIWPFLERARGARPLFDEVVLLEPWREEKLVDLIRARTGEAGLEPSFERLLDQLPRNADEIDRLEAIDERAASYYRLIWDHATGNPGVALHIWGQSLGLDAAGRTFVKLFENLDTSDFEQLPDPAVFVLRAVLQLAPAGVDEVARATRVRPDEIADALRYGLARGYLERVGEGYQVTWTWFRAMTLFLRRRHLLVAT